MSNRPQMSLEHARQDMTGAYPMQGQIQGASQPKQSPLADLGRNGSHVDVGLSGIQRREQSMGLSGLPTNCIAWVRKTDKATSESGLLTLVAFLGSLKIRSTSTLGGV
ncbi:uncharacterized protein EDB91DRAFT_1087383 [Suillus paluster]|uniref:uncharacterized protein n=1 Tax=Suillus paluster TaxID=48578 RepID=UPI001B878A76|nr:uncharacterized protein EDB91DRAFT_1087383 [Suillus paluster]KAG1724713.1 hypothetical protein EDB91DRAFT_1087383 [Suillus paluster]